jgi:transcription-repair coupling factor (superfamily II helicase)
MKNTHRLAQDEAIKSLVEIQIGDPIVHESYGVGRYLGLKTQTFDGLAQDFLLLEYANHSKLMVPMTSLNLISRYSGASPDIAPLHKLGTNQWSKAKQKAHEALHDIATDLFFTKTHIATDQPIHGLLRLHICQHFTHGFKK